MICINTRRSGYCESADQKTTRAQFAQALRTAAATLATFAQVFWRRMGSGLVGLSLLGALSPAAWAQNQPQPRLPVARLTAGMHVIQAELAVTDAQQAMGMMFRTEMPGNEGMLFVNEVAGVRCFWMRNTLIPLTIAFIEDDGTIVNFADMQPRSDQSHCSAKPVRFALEMPQGWFAKKGVKAGFRLRGKPFQP